MNRKRGMLLLAAVTATVGAVMGLRGVSRVDDRQATPVRSGAPKLGDEGAGEGGGDYDSQRGEQLSARQLAHGRARPDAVTAGALLVPWTRIQTTLGATADKDEETRSMQREVRQLVSVLLATRRNPRQASAFDETTLAAQELADRLRRSAWGTHPEVEPALAEQTAIISRYANR